jgi:hypothetical protein
MTERFLRPDFGSDSNDSLTFATARRTVNTGMSAALISPGDYIKLVSSPDPTLVGNATFTNKSDNIVLTEELVQVVNLCEAAWSVPGGSGNSSSTDSTNKKYGSRASTLTVAGSFTTGLAAYTTTASGDYSTSEQLSFWIKPSLAVAASSIRFSLCSDALGATPVDDFTITHNLLSNRWYPLTIDKSSALGNSIQSIALYVDIDLGGSSVTFTVDHMVACLPTSNAKSLTLNSLVGKNLDTECWYPVRAFDGVNLKLDQNSQSLGGTTPKGYSGASETTSLYKRECFKMPPADTSTAINTANEAGTSGNPITYSGGWDRAAMTSQTGETWFDALCGQNTGFTTNSLAYINLEKIKIVRGSTGIIVSGANSVIGELEAVGCDSGGIQLSGNTMAATGYIKACSNSSTGISITGNPISIEDLISVSNNNSGGIVASTAGTTLTITGAASSYNNTGAGIDLGGTVTINSIASNDNTTSGITVNTTTRGPLVITSVSASSNGAFGLNTGSSGQNLAIQSFTTGGNTSGAITTSMSSYGSVYINTPLSAEATFSSGTITAGSNAKIITQNEGGVPNYHVIRTDGGTISTDVTGTNNRIDAGRPWKLSPTSATRTTTYPLRLSIAKFAVDAGSQVTVTAYLKRDSSDVTARLVVPGNQIRGMGTADLTATISAVGSYEAAVITFTPTDPADLSFEVCIDAFGGTTNNVWVHGVYLTQ